MWKASGIEVANCESCSYLGSESDSNWPEIAQTWPVCRRKPHMGNLKGFPFKTDMQCWVPESWASKFAGMIQTGNANEVDQLHGQFMEAIASHATLPPAKRDVLRL